MYNNDIIISINWLPIPEYFLKVVVYTYEKILLGTMSLFLFFPIFSGSKPDFRVLSSSGFIISRI